MSVLNDQISATLPPQLYVPQPIQLLFDWIEENGFLCELWNGSMGGRLADSYDFNEAETEKFGGTGIYFEAQGNYHLRHWLGNDDPDILNRLYVFAQTGGDGSMAAFWRDDSGQQKIVHLGSGSGSTMVCVLADDPVDFLRLIAIGYEEICWPDVLFDEPNGNQDLDYFIHPNHKYQSWVRETFDVTIPEFGVDIVMEPAGMMHTESDDPFWIWCETHCG